MNEPTRSPVIGRRFRRPLTQDELDAIAAAAQDEGLEGAIRATWDLLLSEAEGCTMAEATARGLKFYPAEYAIPDSQSRQLFNIWYHAPSPYVKRTGAGYQWLNIGPGSYPGESEAEAADTYDEAKQSGLPLVAADLTWTKVNGGHAVGSLSDWVQDRVPVVGETVLVSGGGPYLPATIVAVTPDAIHLHVPLDAQGNLTRFEDDG